MARRHSLKIPIEKLPQAVNQILKEYDDDVSMTVSDVVRKVTDQGTRALRSNSASVINGRYGANWSFTIEKGRLFTTGIIYHKVPGLPHLLEHGHAKVTGGRVPGRPHIAPVEETIERSFFDKTVRGLQEI